MKKVQYAGGAFLASLFIHLLMTVAFLFLPVSDGAKAMCLGIVLLLSGGCLIASEVLLNQAERDSSLEDQELGQIYLLKKSTSSVFCAAGVNTFAYIVNQVIPVSLVVTGVLALIYALVCVINVLTYLLAQRSDREEEPDYTEPQEEQI